MIFLYFCFSLFFFSQFFPLSINKLQLWFSVSHLIRYAYKRIVRVRLVLMLINVWNCTFNASLHRAVSSSSCSCCVEAVVNWLSIVLGWLLNERVSTSHTFVSDIITNRDVHQVNGYCNIVIIAVYFCHSLVSAYWWRTLFFSYSQERENWL